ncbi:hypothetical protein ENKNEFLB_03545 [Nocardioides aquaticus]|uniref:Uncharacterized protein n=1 Tax=Nocardioides aquaticus TaxID=160826 RepID=A0ABX8EPF0_9ACTN|nr:hypothetical protein ENKNEFLB_03545 [Nocardioides aquaticus]
MRRSLLVTLGATDRGHGTEVTQLAVAYALDDVGPCTASA